MSRVDAGRLYDSFVVGVLHLANTHDETYFGAELRSAEFEDVAHKLLNTMVELQTDSDEPDVVGRVHDAYVDKVTGHLCACIRLSSDSDEIVCTDIVEQRCRTMSLTYTGVPNDTGGFVCLTAFAIWLSGTAPTDDRKITQAILRGKIVYDAQIETKEKVGEDVKGRDTQTVYG